MDCISFYQPQPEKLLQITSAFPVRGVDKLSDATFLGLGANKLEKSPVMSFQFVEASVFPFLKSSLELDANHDKFALFVFDEFKIK